MPWMLIGLFCVTAMLYASVGFGGGSTYNALLVLNGTDYRILPTLALSCNILVVAGGLWRFHTSGYLNIKRMVPFLVASVPAAWFGGRLIVSETLFIGLLGFALLLSGLRLLTQRTIITETVTLAPRTTSLAPIIGAIIGLLSGVVGIGGGIFLAPILYFLKWGSARQIAAACSLFIFTNSIAGLSGQLTKLGTSEHLVALLPFWPLLPAVFFGGQIGSYMASKGLHPIWIKRLTSVLILYVAARLLYRWLAIVI